MKLFPDSLSAWLRFGFLASITACIGLLLYCHVLTDLRWGPGYFNIPRAAIVLQTALALLFLVSLALLPLNRRLAILGLIASIIAFALYPIVTGITKA